MPREVESTKQVNENRDPGWLRNEKVLDEVTEIGIWAALEEGKHWAGQRNLELGMPQRVESAERVIWNRVLGWLRNGKEPDEVTEIAVWDTLEEGKHWAGQRNLEFGMSQRVESAEQVNKNRGSGWLRNEKVPDEVTEI